MKTCSKCGQTKPTTDFHKKTGTQDGLRTYCKACAIASVTEWQTKNKVKKNSNNAKWRETNPDKAKESGAKWRAANAEKVKAAKLKWRSKNPESRRMYKRNRRARKLEVGGILSKGLSAKLFAMQRGKCACCGEPLGDDFHLDHIMPLALGGSNTDDNIQLLRATCNRQKHAKHPVEFMQSRGRLL